MKLRCVLAWRPAATVQRVQAPSVLRCSATLRFYSASPSPPSEPPAQVPGGEAKVILSLVLEDKVVLNCMCQAQGTLAGPMAKSQVAQLSHTLGM